MRAALLTFNVPQEQLGKLRFICMRMGLPLKAFPPSCWSRTIQDLWQTTAVLAADDTPAPFADPVLVMCGFSRDQVNTLLAAMKQSRLSPIALKAMATPTNCGWTPVQLRDELMKEHQAMHQGQAPSHQPQS